MLFLENNGYRVIAHDRRSHGRSDQTWTGNDMDTYADDLATLLATLDIKGATMIGHSTGGGEVARYIGRHGTSRVSKAVLISAVPPHMAQTPTNPNSAPMSVFDGLRSSLVADRAGFFKELAMPFFGYNRPSAKVSQGQIDSFWLQGMMGSLQGEYDCIKAFSETDFTDDLKKMTIPTLLLQGDDDQIVPIDIALQAFGEDPAEGDPEGICRRPAWHVRHPRRPSECRPVGFPQRMTGEVILPIEVPREAMVVRRCMFILSEAEDERDTA